MRIARFPLDDVVRVGSVVGDVVQPLDPHITVLDLLAMTPAERSAVDRVGDAMDVTHMTLLAPIEPTSIRDFMTFEEHVEGTIQLSGGAGAPITPEWFEAPTFYFTNAAALTGAHDDVPIPPGCELLDFELEVAAVVGRSGRDLSPAEAHEHIAAYTIFNDWSARDLQGREMRVRLGPCKGKDFANTLGPWLVTADELEEHRIDDRLHLDAEVWINGEHIGDDTFANMGWSFEEMVAYASRGTDVRAGDVLGSGTMGSGCLAESWGRRQDRTPPPLRDGDVVTMTVEGIGTIRNRVVAGTGVLHDIPSARPPRHLRHRPAPS
jgi:2-keto-4-pentenoate hydratase/2-oxohepta-3-ene-1,7-dioic acid hydratase in catechol pathway